MEGASPPSCPQEIGTFSSLPLETRFSSFESPRPSPIPLLLRFWFLSFPVEILIRLYSLFFMHLIQFWVYKLLVESSCCSSGRLLHNYALNRTHHLAVCFRSCSNSISLNFLNDLSDFWLLLFVMACYLKRRIFFFLLALGFCFFYYKKERVWFLCLCIFWSNYIYNIQILTLYKTNALLSILLKLSPKYRYTQQNSNPYFLYLLNSQPSNCGTPKYTGFVVKKWY